MPEEKTRMASSAGDFCSHIVTVSQLCHSQFGSIWEPGFTSGWAQACQKLILFWSPQDTQVEIADYNGMIL